MITIEDKEKLNALIESQGFDYAIIEYGDDFDNILDKEFTDLVKKYREIYKKLQEKIGFE